MGMTAPTLPTTLTRLAELLPKRVRVDWNDTDPADVWLVAVEVDYHGWRDVWWGGDNPQWTQAWALEMALREECEARGWRWWSYRGKLPSNYGAQVYVTGDEADDHYADTPAHALALAVEAALSDSE